MKRKILLVVFVLAVTLPNASTTFADGSGGQTTKTGSRSFWYDLIALIVIMVKWSIWAKVRTEAARKAELTEKQTGKRPNSLRGIVMFTIIFGFAVILGNILVNPKKSDPHAEQKTTASSKRGHLGAKVRDIGPGLAATMGIQEGACVQVTRVDDQSPAAKYGLHLNDFIVTISGRPLRSGYELQKVLSELPVDQAVDVVVYRDRRSLKLKITMESQSDDFGSKSPKSND